MGVTLERVQFKFASIIGELCSEPKILSQFAVWLDMRLAEFKLKGSISLDCSGEPTPPEWMQGMGEVLAANAVHQSRNVAPSSTEYSERGDEIIIEDPQIMSDNVHTTESFQSNCSRTADMNRKRSYPPWQADQLYQSTPKSARFLADHKDTESNQSLMSIIAETADSETSIQSPLSNDGPSFTITDTGGTKDFEEGNKLSQYYQPIQTSAQPTSSTQMNSNIYHRGMFYQPRERSVWSTEERCAIRSHLLPIVRRTKKPPTKADIQALMLREPSLRNRHWEKIKFQAWSLYQTLMRRQNSRRKAENSTETSDQNESEQKTSTCV